MHLAFDRDSKIVPMLYFRSSLFSSILAIVKATKQVRKCASICSFVQTYTGLASSCILRSLADSDAFQSGRCAEHNGRPETLAIIN